MDMRKDSSENKIYFQSDRMFRANHGYFFQCRDGQEHGPYPDLRTANQMLSRYLIEKSFEEEQKTARQKIAKTHTSSVAVDQFHDTIDYLETLEQEIYTEFDCLEDIETFSFGGDDTTPPESEKGKASEQSNIEVFRPQTNKTITRKNNSGASSNNLVDINSAVNAKKTQAQSQSPSQKFLRNHELLLEAKEIGEYVLGAEVGTLTVLNESRDLAFSFNTNDKRFEIAGRRLKLKQNEYIDFEADSPVCISVTAKNKDGQVCKQAFNIEVVPLPKY